MRCHQASLYATDGLAKSHGARDKRLPRNANTVFNAALHFSQHWRGDFETVEYICSGINRAPIGTIEHCCEQYALTRGIAQQHRNKVQLQAARIVETMTAKPRASRILSLACGSCPDLRAIPNLADIAGEIWLNDADAGDCLALDE